MGPECFKHKRCALFRTLNFNCTVVRFEQVQGRQDLGAIAVKFDDVTVPSEYKIRLSSYLKTLKRAKKAPEQGK